MTADGSACYKEWYGPWGKKPAGMQDGGRILAEGEVSPGTQIQCPEERVQAILKKAQEPKPL